MSDVSVSDTLNVTSICGLKESLSMSLKSFCPGRHSCLGISMSSVNGQSTGCVVECRDGWRQGRAVNSDSHHDQWLDADQYLGTDQCSAGVNWTTRGYANSRTGHLADWSTRGLDNSRTSQLADWTSRGLDNSRSCRCRQTGKLSTQSRRWHPRVVQSATCPVRELSSPRVDQSVSRLVCKLAYPRVVQ